VNTQSGGPPPIPSGSGNQIPEKKQTILALVLAGAIVALVFVSLILCLVLWKLGFFGASRTAAEPASSNVQISSRTPGLGTTPVLRIQSKSGNVLAGKDLVIAGSENVLNGDGYLMVSDSPGLTIQGPITVSAWFKARSFDKAMTIASRAQNGPPWSYPFVSWLVRVNTDTVLEGNVGDKRSYADPGWKVPPLLPDRWYHIAMVYDGAAVALFLDGQACQTRVSGNPNFARNINNVPGRQVFIGADQSEAPVGDLFNGMIDDVSIFNEGLSPQEIQGLFRNGAQKHSAQ
jgi:hypothetical protein